jgi:hypothetical protein
MIAESPVKMIDEETTKKRFKKTNFYCLRCGAPDVVKKDNVKYFAERKISILEVNPRLLMMWKQHSLLLLRYIV